MESPYPKERNALLEIAKNLMAIHQRKQAEHEHGMVTKEAMTVVSMFPTLQSMGRSFDDIIPKEEIVRY